MCPSKITKTVDHHDRVARKRATEKPQITLFFAFPASSSSQASWSSFCDCVWQLLSAIRFSNSVFQSNLVILVYNFFWDPFFTTPVSKFSLQLLLQSCLCNLFIAGAFYSACLQLLFAPAFCNFCFQLFLQLLFASKSILQLLVATRFYSSSLKLVLELLFAVPFATPSGCSFVCSGFCLPSSQVVVAIVVLVVVVVAASAVNVVAVAEHGPKMVFLMLLLLLLLLLIQRIFGHWLLIMASLIAVINNF